MEEKRNAAKPANPFLSGAWASKCDVFPDPSNFRSSGHYGDSGKYFARIQSPALTINDATMAFVKIVFILQEVGTEF